MSYRVDNKRITTMLERVGDAAQLIDNKGFLPFYRSIQLKLQRDGHPDEWAKMIQIALTKEQPSRYFAKLCAMVKAGTYKFAEAVKEIVSGAAVWIDDKLVKFGFGKYHKYWVKKAVEFENMNSRAGLVELLELADRKKSSQRYVATMLKNGQTPQEYYKKKILGAS